jgi:hypothetical protein
MFSATKFVVVGVIVALFGAFLFSGVLTQPSEESAPAVGASASAQAEPTDAATAAPERTPEAEADSTNSTPDLLLGVDLVTKEVEPGVYRVLSDGIRDLTNGVRNVTVTPEGDAWVWVMGVPRSRTASCPWDRCRHDWSLVRLGEPGVSYKVRRDNPWRLGLTADGVSITGRPKGSGKVTRVFDGEAWQKTDLTPYDKCAKGAIMVGADGGCYKTRFADDREVVLKRIDPDGSRTLYTRSTLGLGPDQFADFWSVGPDGTIWSPVVRSSMRDGSVLDGLVAFDGSAWSWVPYDGDAAMTDPWSGMAVEADGVVWVAFVRGPILSWDGDSWTEHPLEVGRKDSLFPVRSWPNGTVWFGSDARWDGTTLSLAEPAIPWGSSSQPATAPDGSAWTVIDNKLYVISPEAVAATE